MAEIWLAEQEGPEGFAKELVIKRILPHLAKDEQFTAMFLDEARLAAQLTHPNIGQILELGQLEDDYYIAMEFIDGLSLEQVIDKALEDDEPIDCDLAARIIADTLQALDYAHGFEDRDGKPLDIVHRDVTPSNILVSKDGIVKLVDFGVAKASAKQSKTQTGAVKGKYAYMSPEQIETEAVDHRSDLFALGVVFYELLTLTKPFGDELAAVSGILSRDPDDPRNIREDVPEPYVQIIGKALQKDKEERYASAQTMLLDIETTLRMRNAYVGPREVSRLIRSQLGLKVASATAPEQIDSGLFVADRSGEMPQAATADGSGENESTAALGFLPTAAVKKVAGAMGEMTPSASDAEDISTGERVRRLSEKVNLIWVFGGLVVAIAVTAAVLVSIVLTRDKDRSDEVWEAGGGETRVIETKETYAEGSDPDIFRHSDGKLVIVETIPSSEIYRKGKLVARTPFQTTLKPDRYAVELKSGDETKRVTIHVRDEPEFQRFRLILADLDQRTVESESADVDDDGGKSKSPALINKIKSIFP